MRGIHRAGKACFTASFAPSSSRARADGGYSFIDSTTRISITHRASNTRLRVLSSNGRTAFGIVGCPLLVADEPGSWEVVGGTLMYDAITTALGKPNSPMRTVFIGTLAPSMVARPGERRERRHHLRPGSTGQG